MQFRVSVGSQPSVIPVPGDPMHPQASRGTVLVVHRHSCIQTLIYIKFAIEFFISFNIFLFYNMAHNTVSFSLKETPYFSLNL